MNTTLLSLKLTQIAISINGVAAALPRQCKRARKSLATQATQLGHIARELFMSSEEIQTITSAFLNGEAFVVRQSCYASLIEIVATEIESAVDLIPRRCWSQKLDLISAVGRLHSVAGQLAREDRLNAELFAWGLRDVPSARSASSTSTSALLQELSQRLLALAAALSATPAPPAQGPASSSPHSTPQP